MRTAKAHAGASDEGANGDEVAASARRCPYAASGSADDPKARNAASGGADDPKARTPEANRSDNGARYEGSGDDEAKVSAVLRAYASAASNSDEAAAVTARRTSRAAVNDGKVARGGRCHPPTAPTVSDAAHADND